MIKGDISLIGNSPLTDDQAGLLKEDWETMRFKAPTGLFHLWEVEGDDDLNREEKLVSENYYAVTRSFWRDVRILPKSFFPF